MVNYYHPESASQVPASGRAVKLSLIVPCLNEEDNVGPLFARISDCLRDIDNLTWEIVFVDDGSKDGTLRRLEEIARLAAVGGAVGGGASRIRVISFSRNFGKEAALLAGMREANADYIGLIDADLQQDPGIALELLELLEANLEYDVAAAKQENRRESRFLKFCKSAFYRFFSVMADDIDIPADVSDFRVFRRSVAEALLQMPEYYRFSKGMFAWVGFNTICIPYEPKARNAGESSWGFRKLVKYAVNGMISFSTRPLRLATWLGTAVSLVSALYLAYVVIVDYLILGISIPGYPTLVCLILLLGGIQLLALGIMSEYLARTYIETKHRPPYVVRKRIFSEDLPD